VDIRNCSSVPLPLVIKPEDLKEALQWRSDGERKCKVSQSNRTDKGIELALQFTLVERRFHSKNNC